MMALNSTLDLVLMLHWTIFFITRIPTNYHHITLLGILLGGGSVNGKKPRKPRTIFTAGQLLELEHKFRHQKYLSTSERSCLAFMLGLSEEQVSAHNLQRNFLGFLSITGARNFVHFYIYLVSCLYVFYF